MKINCISFKGYDEPYPIGGGKIEKYEYEIKHGMRPSPNYDTFESSSDKSIPTSISDIFSDGRCEHNPWFPLDD